jgi:uncharacterized protein
MRAFLTAEWRNLVFFNYEVEPGLLQPHAPRGTTLDTYDGRTFVSLIAFQFLATRVLSLPIPLHQNFTEANLRFYVRRDVGAETRHGVVFLREVVPRRAVATVARLLYNEPYITLPMRHDVHPTPPPRVAYEWRQHGTWRGCSAQAQDTGRIPDAETLEHFLVEKPWGYTRQRDGGTIEYGVDHDLWTVWRAADFQAPTHLSDLCDAPVVSGLGKPSSVLIADGSAVTVTSPHRVP